MRIEHAVAAVVLECWAKEESVVAAIFPRAAYCGLGVDEDSASGWSHRCRVKVLWAEQTFPCRSRGIVAWSQEV